MGKKHKFRILQQINIIDMFSPLSFTNRFSNVCRLSQQHLPETPECLSEPTHPQLSFEERILLAHERVVVKAAAVGVEELPQEA